MYSDIMQGTPEWHDIRRGKISATHMADILMKDSQAGYRNYLAKLVCECITGITEESYCNSDMQRGIDLEESARACYSFLTGNAVHQVAWVDHPTIENAGCSPDGIIGDAANDFPVGGEIGMVEFKCPKQATHLLDYFLAEKIDRNYILQMQWQMECVGAQWNDFCSYHPSFPEDKQLKIIRVHRDDKVIEELKSAAIAFNEQVIKTIAELEAKC